MVFKPVGIDENGQFPNRVSTALDNRIGSHVKVSGANTQSALMGEALRKIRKREAVKIVARGDSTTYGHDTVSVDKVAAPTAPLPDGSTHSATRSPKPWPAALQDCLNVGLGGTNVTVENQGYSGDHVLRGYNRWINNVDADITLISYGINDASAAYVPADKRGNIPEFIADTEKMILRDLAWGSAVILLTPTRQLGQAGNVDTDSFRNAWYSLANKYGIPVIDGEMFLDTQQRDAWSDGNHLSTKGNYVMGARLAAVFLSENPIAPVKVSSGSKLLVRPTMHGFVKGSIDLYSNSTGYPTPEDNVAGQGTAISLQQGSSGSLWTFFTDAPDLLVIPSSYLQVGAGESGASIEYILDFDASQGDDYNDRASGDVALDFTNTENSLIHGPITTGNSYNDVGVPTSAFSLRVATPGWHTLRAVPTKSVSSSLTVVHNLEFSDRRVWQATKDTVSNASRITTLEAIKSRGVYNVDVPASYDESTDIMDTKISVGAIYEGLFGVADLNQYYKYDPIKLTVTSYGGAILEYLIHHTISATHATDIAAKTVDSAAATSNVNVLTLVTKLRETSLLGTGAAAGTNTAARELASISYLGATKQLVFNWKTLNSDGTTAKNMKRNFTMAFTPL